MAGFIKEAELALLGGLIVGVFFAAMKLIPPMPPLLGSIGAAGVLMGGFCYELIIKLIFKQ
jgi:xanthosine utilization system XapX-like protein